MSKEQEEALSNERLIPAGLLSISSLAVIQLLVMGELSPRLNDAMYCFAVAIPALSFVLIAMEYKYGNESKTFFYSLMIGVLSAFVGIFMIIFHISSGAGIVFGVMAFYYAFWGLLSGGKKK